MAETAMTVARSIITNYSLPEPRMALLIRVSVAYDTDVDRLEEVLLDEAKRVIPDVPGLLAEPRPLVRFIPGFGDSSLDFTLVCHVATFVDQFEAQHVLGKRLLARLRAERIEIPYPARSIYMRTDGAVSAEGTRT